MSNPLFNMLGGNQQMPMNNQIIQRFNQFRNTFTGNPREQVQGLLNSGRITQEQYNNAVNLANQFANFIK